MAETLYVVVQGNILKDGPALHGADIKGSYLYPGTTIVIGIVDDAWGKLVGPKPDLVRPDGTYLNYGKVAWFPMGHLAQVNAQEHEYRLITDAGTGAVKSCVMIR